MSIFKLDIKEMENFAIISGFSIKVFFQDIYNTFKTKKLLKLYYQSFALFGRGTLKVHIFFLPELVYILSILPARAQYKKLTNLILEKTWMSSTQKKYVSKISMTKIDGDINYNLKSYQRDFIKLYDDKKQKYKLNGYILAFEQGLGKTFTSLALMHGLSKNAIIIVAPKSTIRTVWKNEIENVFKNEQSIWVVGDPIIPAKFFIVNYESIDKLKLIIPQLLKAKNIGIIVDECHNFRNINAKRVINLISIAKFTKCKDILLMSGTPIKALGLEMIPALNLIDPLFDKRAQEIFIKTFGLSSMVALSILKNRLGLVMHRKMKQEVLSLPNKINKTIKIKIPNGDKYTLEYVKDQVQKYIKERQDYYTKGYKEYQKDFNECLAFLKSKLEKDKMFEDYLGVIEELKKHGYSHHNLELVRRVSQANKYEKNTLRPLLTPELRKKFDKSKSVIKYVNLKIMGEVIGGLLNRLRSQMFSDMIQKSPLCEIINSSEKKTICFTTFVDVVKSTNEFVKNKCKLNPSLVYGETTKNITSILKDFKTNIHTNPLIATIQTLATGVTLIEANSVIFINQPWRHVDKIQAEDRVHRIGQESEVFIYTFILDTGGKPNLSTRMDDIVSWSKDMFEGIVGKDEVVKHQKIFQKLKM